MDKVFISGGGTGGHFYPALSVAKELEKEGYSVTYIGTTAGIEAQKEFPVGKKILFDMYGVRGKNLINRIKGVVSLVKTTYRVFKLLKEEKPKFSICFGGYTSIPLGVASFLTGVPLFIHEQNSIPSYSNLILSKFSRKIFITFEYTKRYFNSKKTVLSGMPLRDSVLEAAKSYQPSEKISQILVIGGSQGSKKINQTVVEMAEDFPDITFHIILGKSNLEPADIPKNVKLYNYVDNVEKLFSQTDIVISRSGSSTVNEIITFGKYAIFIPYPYAASNHQYYNVKFLKDLGLSDLIEDRDLTKEKLKESIDKAKGLDLKSIYSRLRQLAKTDAKKVIISSIKEELDGKN
ncbi:MAG: undecaprenyldiphospho-muramoylpentapeptide beta-N-acetylglucosaminyltransferase [Hydrogenothermaceae bacterium]